MSMRESGRLLRLFFFFFYSLEGGIIVTAYYGLNYGMSPKSTKISSRLLLTEMGEISLGRPRGRKNP